jgi:hypothetical protein
MNTNEKIAVLTQMSPITITYQEHSIVAHMPNCTVRNVRLCKEFAKAREKAGPRPTVPVPGRARMSRVLPDALDSDPRFEGRVQALCAAAPDFTAAIDKLYALATAPTQVIERSYESIANWGDSYIEHTMHRLKDFNGRKKWTALSETRAQKIRSFDR